MGLVSGVIAQFKHPTGLAGALVGQLMAFKNGKRSAWVLSALAPREGERVLEVGFGPGVDARRVLELVGKRGHYDGVDISSVMVRQASRRNGAAAGEGRARFVLGSLDDGLPLGDGEIDAAFAINCAQFWASLEGGMREIARVLRPGGRLVVAVQPMRRGATRADSERWAHELAGAARSAELSDVEILFGPTSPPVAAVRASR